MKKINVLIVEDDADMRQTMTEGLQREGYEVSQAANAKELFAKIKTASPDAVLLDIGLPDENGLAIIEKIRGYTSAPVIVVSGMNDSMDKIIGLEMGADDYVGKPFQMKELSARIKAQLRRTTRQSPSLSETTKSAEKISFGNWVMDRPRLQVFDREGVSAELTVKEFKLLEAFISAPNRVLSREQLLELSRSHGFNVTDRAIDTQMVRLRKKLGCDTDDLIQAVRGAGYMFVGKIEIM